MDQIPIPPMADLSNNIAYAAAAIAVVTGVVMLGWGRFWSRPLVGLMGVGIGFMTGELLAEWMQVDLWMGRSAMASVLGVLGFVAAPFFWASFAGAFCASVGGVFLAENFVAKLVAESGGEANAVVEPVGGANAIGQQLLCEPGVPFIVVVLEVDRVIDVELENV